MSYKVFISRETEPDFISEMVMLKTNANFSHIGIIEDDKTVWHATHVGFNQMPVEQFLTDHMFVDTVEIKVESVDFTKGYLRGMEGIEYSASQYLGFVIPFMAKFIKNGKEKLVCSEAVMRFMDACTSYCHCPDDEDDDFYDPKEAWEVAKEIAAAL